MAQGHLPGGSVATSSAAASSAVASSAVASSDVVLVVASAAVASAAVASAAAPHHPNITIAEASENEDRAAEEARARQGKQNVQTSPRVSAETCQLPGGMVARGSVVGSVVVDEPFKKKARNPLDGGHSEASYQSCDYDLGADYDRDSPHASGDEAEVQAQLADLRYEKECSHKELAVARAKCKAAADELVRLRDENEKLTISNAELFDDLGELEAQMGKRPHIKDVLDVMRSGGWEEKQPSAHGFVPTRRVPPRQLPERFARGEQVFRGIR